MKTICKFGIILLLAIHNVQAKVLVMSYHYNRPDFIEIQHKTFEKFLEDDYEFVVFNDAKTPHLEQAIVHMCKKYNIKCIRINPEIHNHPYLQRWPGEGYNSPSVRCSNGVQYSLDTLAFDHQGLAVVMDSDMFLIRPFSIEKYMKNTDLAGVPQGRGNAHNRIRYVWIGLVFLNMNTLPERRTINFNCGRVDGIPVDAGGCTHHYLKNHPEIKVKNIGILHNQNTLCQECRVSGKYRCTHNNKKLERLGFNKNEIDFLQIGPPNIEFLLNNTFLHYRGGTNWDNQSASFHNNKTSILNNFINTILSTNS